MDLADDDDDDDDDDDIGHDDVDGVDIAHNNDVDDDDDDDDNNDDDDDAGRPSVQLHSPAPSSENQESHQPRSPASRPIKLLRPKESVPPVNRQLKYNLRKNPSPSRKYQ